MKISSKLRVKYFDFHVYSVTHSVIFSVNVIFQHEGLNAVLEDVFVKADVSYGTRVK